MPATTLKLSEELKKRIAAAAEGSGKSSHAFMVEAIEQQTALAELRKAFVASALAAEDEALKSGVGYSAADVHAYLEALTKGKRSVRPKARRWRR